MDYNEYWNQIYEKSDQLNSLISSYWNHYSNMETWQFWFIVSLLVVPLILLYFKVDRERIFELFFFGYTVNMLWTFTDIALEGSRYLVHLYFFLPMLPYALNLTASLIPVGFILLYQYCTNNKKNFYLFTLLLSAIFSFVFAPIEKYLGFIELRKGFNLIYLFLIDVGIAFISYWFTKIILKIKGGHF
ncbi:hypothetical protein [Tuberibacillus sp. Marseille-P3662]|uniref:hypothetical protein n=1 Tax=Tuberibacillus sp. Marseille-P3662 TaxID=1965358 RepID=UPI000A1C87D3|nr:hypothetical protein [Tuberibacillus sp. Marseille-P3662]